jgi:hypothetical protein
MDEPPLPLCVLISDFTRAYRAGNQSRVERTEYNAGTWKKAASAMDWNWIGVWIRPVQQLGTQLMIETSLASTHMEWTGETTKLSHL